MRLREYEGSLGACALQFIQELGAPLFLPQSPTTGLSPALTHTAPHC